MEYLRLGNAGAKPICLVSARQKDWRDLLVLASRLITQGNEVIIVDKQISPREAVFLHPPDATGKKGDRAFALVSSSTEACYRILRQFDRKREIYYRYCSINSDNAVSIIEQGSVDDLESIVDFHSWL